MYKIYQLYRNDYLSNQFYILPMHSQCPSLFQQLSFSLASTMTLDHSKSLLKNQDDETYSQEQSNFITLPKHTMLMLHHQSTTMAQTQFQNYLVIAFCLFESDFSTISLQLIKKKQKLQTLRSLKSIKLEITILKLKLNKFNELYLLAGTKCGRILVYYGFENLQLEINCKRISTHPINNITISSLQNKAFILTNQGTIYLFDFQQLTVILQLQIPCPSIQNNKHYLIINDQQTYLCCAFGYGRLIAWEINDIYGQMNNSFSNLQCKTNKQFSQCRSKDQTNKINKHYNKRIVFKPKSNILAPFIQGIYWISFLGNFLLVLTQKGSLSILAIHLTNQNQSQQLYIPISSYHLHSPNNGYERIFHIQKLRANTGVLVGKNVYQQTKTTIKFSHCLIEKYIFGKHYEIMKMLTVKLPSQSPLSQFRLSTTEQFLICRSQSQSYIFANFPLNQ